MTVNRKTMGSSVFYFLVVLVALSGLLFSGLYLRRHYFDRAKEDAVTRSKTYANQEFETSMKQFEKQRKQIGDTVFAGEYARQLDIQADRQRIAEDPHTTWCSVTPNVQDALRTYDIPERCDDGLRITIWADKRKVVVRTTVSTSKGLPVSAPVVLESDVGEVKDLGNGRFEIWGFVFAKNPAPGEHVVLGVTRE